MTQHQFVRDLRDGARVQSVYLVREKSTPVGKNGKAYLNLTLVDKSGALDARMWNRVEQVAGVFDVFDYVEVTGQVHNYQGRLQLRIDNLTRVEPPAGVGEFLPATVHDPEAMFREVVARVDSVANPWIRQLLRAFLDDEKIAAGFRTAPAAKSVHHPYVGGLLEHTLSIMRLADRVAAHYAERADRSYLLAGALLHDIGKVAELSSARGFEYTDEGRLLGHIVICVEWIGQKARAIPDFPPEVERLVKHLVLSHHGTLEFGSPKRPKTIEALLLNLIDEMDAKLNQWTMAIDQETDARWTRMNRHLDRYLYIGGGEHYDASRASAGRAPDGEEPAPEGNGAQPPTAAKPRDDKARPPREPRPRRDEPLTHNPFTALAGANGEEDEER